MMRTLIARARQSTSRLDAELRTLIENSSWILAANLIRTALAFVRAILVARALGVSSYGVYVLIVAWTTTIRELFDLNLSSAIIKFGAEYRAEQRIDKLVALAKAGLLLSAAAAVVAVLTVWGLALVSYETLTDVPGLRWYVVALAAAVSAQLFDLIWFGLLRLFDRFRLNSILNVALGAADLLIVAAVLWLYPRQLEPFLIAMAGATLLNSMIVNGVALWELWPELGTQARTPIAVLAPQRRELRTFVLANSGTRTLQNLMNRGDVLLLGALSTADQVGFYEIGRRLAYALLRLTDPLAVSINPQTSRLLAEGRVGDLARLLRRAMRLLVLPAAACLLTAVLFAAPGIEVLLGPAFAPAATPLVIHMVAACVYAVVFWAAPVLLGLGRTVFRFWLAAATLSAGAAVAWLLAPAYGANGVAIGSLVAKCSLLLISATVAFRLVRGRLDAATAATRQVQARASASGPALLHP